MDPAIWISFFTRIFQRKTVVNWGHGEGEFVAIAANMQDAKQYGMSTSLLLKGEADCVGDDDN